MQPEPASELAAATRRAFAALKTLYGDGGRKGWDGVREGIGTLQGLLLDSEDGFVEFLASLDRETDAEFLEALLHHLPLAQTELRERILADKDLHEQLWARFEDEETPERRQAFLRFFAFQRDLSASRMGTFVELAKTERALHLRQLCVDAISSHRELIPDTWETLAQVFQHDASPQCRATAVHGLAFAAAPEAKALVKAAFTAPEESLRAAALSSIAGNELPAEVAGADPTMYLVGEFRTAQTREYRKALIDRLLARAPAVLEEEIRSRLSQEQDWAARQDYRNALEKIAAARSRGQGE